MSWRYFSKFGPWNISDERDKDKYYSHMPVYTGGNVYFNGAKPMSREQSDYCSRLIEQLREECL